jgi:hypothetical protein
MGIAHSSLPFGHLALTKRMILKFVEVVEFVEPGRWKSNLVNCRQTITRSLDSCLPAEASAQAGLLLLKLRSQV